MPIGESDSVQSSGDSVGECVLAMIIRTAIETAWWLEWGATASHQRWARLQVFADGSAQVLDLDGFYHDFETAHDAINWLSEDEYSPAEHVIEEARLFGLLAPNAGTDKDLVPLMHVGSSM
jgi:hypothetical protein